MTVPSVTLFGPIDTILGPYAEYAVLVLVISNLLTRKLAHDAHVRQAREGGEDAIKRHPLHVASSWGLVLVSFYYVTLHHHSGTIVAMFALAIFIADLFEFEARRVEARNDMPLESPKGAITISIVALLYAAYISVFFIVAPIWNAIV